MSDRSRLRLVVLRALIVSLLLTLLGRLWYLQVLAGPEYQRAAADNQVRDIVATAPRGEILDDRGRRLATNKTALVVSVDRVRLSRQSDGGRAVLQRLASVLRIPWADLRDKIQLCGPHALPKGCWNGSPYEPIPVTQLKDNLASTRLALQILERKEDFPGVSAELAAVRDYTKPDGARATHVLGYLAPITEAELKKLPKAQQDARRSDLVGRQGLEESYDSYLRGRPGVTQVAVDHLGAVTGTLSRSDPQPGDELVTSLDARVQASLEKALRDAVARAHSAAVAPYGGPADFAAGVVMDAQTGHVVAMASYPDYDPNLFVGGISQRQYDALQHTKGNPLLDKAYVSAYPSGSSFKLISTAGLLADGTASLGGSYDCSPSFSIGSRSFRNFEGEAYGYIDLHKTIVVSCDTVYYRLAYADWVRDNNLVLHHKRPVEGVQRMARAFGLAQSPNIDLPGATTGHIADRRNTMLRWKETRKDYCAGAKRRPKGSYLQLLDREYCTDGWRFNPGDQLNEDIGQGTVLLSPLQLAVAYSALANGGTVFEPRLGKAILGPNGQLIKTLNAPVRDHLPISKTALDYIRNAMYDVPLSGTAAGAFQGFPFNKVKVGGKTGTAEVGFNGQYTSAWFASFAGRRGDKPRFVTVIMTDKGGVGGTVSAPSVREVWDTVFGVEGHQAAFPNGRPPVAMPKVGPPAISGAGPAAATPGAPGSTTPAGVAALAFPPALAVRFSAWTPR